MWLTLLSLAHGAPAPCPSVGVVQQATPYAAERTWLHESGWFEPLDDPETVRLADEGQYSRRDQLLIVRRGDAVRAYPVAAMAYHHVANDTVGGEPVVVTY